VSQENQQEAGQEIAAPEAKGEEIIQLKINRENNELSFVNPINGKLVTIKALIQEEEKPEEREKEEVKTSPLSPEEFRTVLKNIDELGFTWSADILPVPRYKKGVESSRTFNPEYYKIQRKYPMFPRELAAVIIAALMGTKQDAALVGSEDDLKDKIAAIWTLLTPEYRSEFFFKHAIKVPYFEDADWEVVIKTYERGVKDMPRIAYALLSLAFRRPVDPTLPIDQGSREYRKPEFVTVAANEYLLDKLIGLLVNAKEALEKAQQSAASLEEHTAEDEEQTDESLNRHMG
jgi:hypothetical protein